MAHRTHPAAERPRVECYVESPVFRPIPALIALLSVAGPARAEPTARFEDTERPSVVEQRANAARAAQSARQTPSESWARAAARARLERGERHEKRGDAAQALAEYNDAVRLDPSFGEAYLRIASLRHRLGDPREAERAYEQALRSPATRAAALAGRSRARRALGRTEDAFRDLEAAVVLEPTRERLEELAGWYVERRAWPAALVAWRRVLSLLEEHPRTERGKAELSIRALTLLAADADPVSAGSGRGWVRSALAHIARNPR